MWYNLISHDPKESWLLEKEEDDHDGIQAMDPYLDEPKTRSNSPNHATIDSFKGIYNRTPNSRNV